MCIRLSKTIKLCQMPTLIILIFKEKMCTELKNGLTIPLQYFIIVTVYSDPAIDNMSILLCKKHITFFEHDKLNKYTY